MPAQDSPYLDGVRSLTGPAELWIAFSDVESRLVLPLVSEGKMFARVGDFLRAVQNLDYF
jgi:hypothetical protein